MKPVALQPDGRDWHCDVCGHVVVILPTYVGDGTCPDCGCLLWPELPMDGRSQTAQQHLIDMGARLAIDTDLPGWKVNLSNCKVVDTAIALLNELGPITELDLSDTGLTDHGIRRLAEMTTLEDLHLTATRVTNDTLAILAQLAGLQILSLNETKVTDAGIRYLSQLGNLWCLDLDETPVRGTAFFESQLLNQLEILFLSGSKIDDFALKALYNAYRLEELWMTDSDLTAKAVMELRWKLPYCKIYSDVC